MKYSEFNNPQYIESDPIQVPHQFSEKGNIEIAAFLTAIITWGRRNMIIPKAFEFMRMMENQPYEFVLQASENEICSIEKFQYRTFMGLDAVSFVRALRKLYEDYGGLCTVFEKEYKATGDIKQTLSRFRKLFLEYDFPNRSLKHIANVDSGSAAKRLNMFLRWMVRKDNRGVDFGLWTKIPPASLMIPLDVHAGNVARKLGIL
ncbi:MAG: TIGR02757 family protein, partial [Bacteroidota bacterium]|nr:TIGR02757 family protein [Bacteroidota bacterium]